MKTNRKRASKKVESPFGAVMRERREALGMKQDELATGSGYNSRSSIANIEQGSQMPPWDKAVAIADYLQLPLDAFRQADVVAARDKSFIIIEVKTARRLVNHLKKILDDLKKRIDAAQVS